MAKAGALICLLIVSVDVVAGTFGIKAEMKSNKVAHTRLRGSSSSACKGPSHEAFKSGLVAATLQAIAHIAVNLLWGCMCMCFSEELERSAFNLRLWFACLILSWIVVAIGFPMLVIGMLANSKSEGSCGITNSHFLLIGGVLCFAHGLCCIAQYVSAPVTIGHEATNNIHP